MNIHLMSEQERTQARIPHLCKAIREADANKRRVLAKMYRESLSWGKFLGGTPKSVKVAAFWMLYGLPFGEIPS